MFSEKVIIWSAVVFGAVGGVLLILMKSQTLFIAAPWSAVLTTLSWFWVVLGGLGAVVTVNSLFRHPSVLRADIEVRADSASKEFIRTGSLGAVQSWGGRLNGGTVALDGFSLTLEEHFFFWRVTKTLDLNSLNSLGASS